MPTAPFCAADSDIAATVDTDGAVIFRIAPAVAVDLLRDLGDARSPAPATDRLVDAIRHALTIR